MTHDTQNVRVLCCVVLCCCACLSGDRTVRSPLDVAKLWISRRMLVAETMLLRAYGGVGPTVKAQDAIRQGRRVRLR